MGASISQRPSKCLKTTRRPRRSKSEECLGSKQSLTMGRLFAPWHNLVNADNRFNANATAKMLELTANAADKDLSYEMEKSFKQIHRSNSLEKGSFPEADGEKVFIDDGFDSYTSSEKRIVIDVSKDSIFKVDLQKGTRGLGFSVLEYDGFVFIKQLFPLEAASQSGQLQEGDIILSANGNALTHLSSFEALQILRKLDSDVTMIVCRLQQFSKKKPVTSSQTFSNFAPSTTYDCSVQHKEFEIKMIKVNGSLGFTLRKDEENHRNHIVRALVKIPAIDDGRIKPGDQIISVNNREIGDMSHQEAVKFLRDCDDEVVLRLRRETLSSSLTSLSSSHFEDTNRTLRKEAVDMLNTLAVKKLKAENEDRQNNNSDSDVVDGPCSREEEDDDETETEEKYEDDTEDAGLFECKFSALLSNSLSRRVQKDCSNPADNLAEVADEPVSLPALDMNGDKISFQHSDPAYHSINVPNLSAKNLDDPFSQSRISPVPAATENQGLLKWKGVVLDQQTEPAPVPELRSDELTLESIIVQLQRNWNSRLGFSLSEENNFTVISAIHANSVAANDGRLKVGDRILEINARNVQNMDTNEVIKLLRTVRGDVTIRVSRNRLKQVQYVNE